VFSRLARKRSRGRAGGAGRADGAGRAGARSCGL